jgi:hypothetical protein
MANACTSAAQPASLVPSGTVFSWKTVIGASSSFMRRKSFTLIENRHLFYTYVEIHYTTLIETHCFSVEQHLKNYPTIENHHITALG